MHSARRFLDAGFNVTGFDNLNNYYDVQLKLDRLAILKTYKKFDFFKIDLVDKDAVEKIFTNKTIELVIHLAAQAGVRHSINNPNVFVQSNLVGFFNIIELSKKYSVKKILFASSSSVYGNSVEGPSNESEPTDKPLNVYGATKKANELLAYTYSSLYSIECLGLRFFTVYGPWGRPDMAPILFAKSITANKTINLHNKGLLRRDFTFIDDIVEGIYRLALQKSVFANDSVPENKFVKNKPPFEVFNIGKGEPDELIEFVKEIEKALDKKARINLVDMQPGEVVETWANTNILENQINFKPTTNLETGIKEFVSWFQSYYK